jgi:hypothetical protein
MRLPGSTSVTALSAHARSLTYSWLLREGLMRPRRPSGSSSLLHAGPASLRQGRGRFSGALA